MKSVKGVLRIDMRFKSHGPRQLRRTYKKRVAARRVFTRLKNPAGLPQHNLRGMAKITFHTQLCLLSAVSRPKQQSTFANQANPEASDISQTNSGIYMPLLSVKVPSQKRFLPAKSPISLERRTMADDKNEEETYSLIFSSLKHPIRRKILRMLEHHDLTFSEILETLAIDSGHLSYHLDNLGELVNRTLDGKYSLSSFGTAAVKLMGGVEEYDARTTPSRSKAVTIAKIFSLALALTLLLVSFYSMNLVTSTQTNDAYGLSNMPLALAQNQTFNYSILHKNPLPTCPTVCPSAPQAACS